MEQSLVDMLLFLPEGFTALVSKKEGDLTITVEYRDSKIHLAQQRELTYRDIMAIAGTKDVEFIICRYLREAIFKIQQDRR